LRRKNTKIEGIFIAFQHMRYSWVGTPDITLSAGECGLIFFRGIGYEGSTGKYIAKRESLIPIEGRK
jgi:hypothetical protein